ncbi:MAG: KOW domain-containing RNA-binding protein [Bacillota bacterium]|nr:KOW domain-containing RNA-binding protein [Bacillota bacterium]MDW7685135.1 KOW domain-containing RNA-binding protein [Bacillota bacterium]
MLQPPKPGTLVRSVSGRDTGEHYLVVGVLEPNFVLVANGLNRPLKSPKKKNLRHLQIYNTVSVELAEKIRRKKARDEEVARAIREMGGCGHPGGEREGNEPDVKEERRY